MLLSVSGFFILGGQNLALPGATSPTWCCFWWPIKCRVCCSGTGWAADAIYALCLNRSSHQCCQGTEEVQEVHENGTCIMSLVKNPLFYPDLLPAGHSLTLKAEHCRPSIQLTPRSTPKIQVSTPKPCYLLPLSTTWDIPDMQIRWGSFRLLVLYFLKFKERSSEFFSHPSVTIT